MRRRLGRRPIFFALTALICVALVPASPGEFRWVVWATAVLAAFWAIALGAEDLLAPEGPLEHLPPLPPESPFAPPPPPHR